MCSTLLEDMEVLGLTILFLLCSGYEPEDHIRSRSTWELMGTMCGE